MTIANNIPQLDQNQFNHQQSHANNAREFGRPDLSKLEVPKEERTPVARTDENPFEERGLENGAWQAFVNASYGASDIAEESIRMALFEDGSNSNLTAISLLDWADKAKALRENISVPQSTTTDISDFQKQAIADQIKNLAQEQIHILDTFSFLIENGTDSLGLDIVA
jgi:hypothetical protein